MQEHSKKAIEILEQGGIVIFPTDTAFGIGCWIDNEDAVKKLFSIRKRPATQAMPVLCDSISMVRKYVTEIPKSVEAELMAKHWPGALTVILSANIKNVPSLVRGGGVNVGVRIPNHQTPLTFISSVGVPLLGSSANFSGEPTPYRLADINPQLLSLVDYVVPGVCTTMKESTVVDTTVVPWKIVRQGAIRLEL